MEGIGEEWRKKRKGSFREYINWASFVHKDLELFRQDFLRRELEDDNLLVR